MIEKKVPPGAELTIKIIKNYYVVSSPEFGVLISAGHISQATVQSIGSAVVKCMRETLKRSDEGEKPRVRNSVSVGEASKYLRLSPSSIRRLIHKSELKSIRTAGGHRRICMESLRKILEMQI